MSDYLWAKIPHQLIDDETISDKAKILYQKLKRFEDFRTGECKASYSLLKMRRNTISQLIKELETKGYLAVFRKDRSQSRYFFTLPTESGNENDTSLPQTSNENDTSPGKHSEKTSNENDTSTGNENDTSLPQTSNESVTVFKNEIDKERERARVRATPPPPPSQEEVLLFGKEHRYSEHQCIGFFMWYSAKGWKGILEWPPLLHKWVLNDRKEGKGISMLPEKKISSKKAFKTQNLDLNKAIVDYGDPGECREFLGDLAEQLIKSKFEEIKETAPGE